MAPVPDLGHSTRMLQPTSAFRIKLASHLQVKPSLLHTIFHCRKKHSSSKAPFLTLSTSPASLHRPLRYAVLGAGFAGLSVAWHLLELSPKGSNMSIDIIDEVGIGGGASGVAGGLLHPYSPKARVLWRGAECWKECLKLLDVAERAGNADELDGVDQDWAISVGKQIVWRRGILRPATTMKNAEILKENAQSCIESCGIKLLDRDSAQSLVPDLHVPSNSAVYMPFAVNIHPKRYLQALFLACKSLAADLSASECGAAELNLCKKSVESLQELAGEYDSVIICLGARADMLPELSGKLPIRTCRGIVAHLQLPDDVIGEYGANSPSILSDAWIAVQGSRNAIMGSTWEWQSRNYSASVSAEEASSALEELLPKASAVYPAIRKWACVGASAGLRAMPPLTSLGSLPLLGSVGGAVGDKVGCRYWLIGGLGSRGLLYHSLLGNLTAQAVISCSEDAIPSELTSWKKRCWLKEAG